MTLFREGLGTYTKLSLKILCLYYLTKVVYILLFITVSVVVVGIFCQKAK